MQAHFNHPPAGGAVSQRDTLEMTSPVMWLWGWSLCQQTWTGDVSKDANVSLFMLTAVSYYKPAASDRSIRLY